MKISFWCADPQHENDRKVFGEPRSLPPGIRGAGEGRDRCKSCYNKELALRKQAIQNAELRGLLPKHAKRLNKAVGAAGSAVARRENGKKRKSAEPSASSAIAGASNKRVAGDGTAASVDTVVAPFPSDVYEVDLEMPVRDDTLIGKQILHVADLGKGSGLEFVQFTVAAESISTTTMPPASPGPGRGSSNS